MSSVSLSAIDLTGESFESTGDIDPAVGYDGPLFAGNRVQIQDDDRGAPVVLVHAGENELVGIRASSDGTPPSTVDLARSTIRACEQRLSLDAGRGLVHDTELDVVLACRVNRSGDFILRPLDARRGYQYSLSAQLNALVRCADALFDLKALADSVGVDLGVRRTRSSI